MDCSCAAQPYPHGTAWPLAYWKWRARQRSRGPRLCSRANAHSSGPAGTPTCTGDSGGSVYGTTPTPAHMTRTRPMLATQPALASRRTRRDGVQAATPVLWFSKLYRTSNATTPTPLFATQCGRCGSRVCLRTRAAEYWLTVDGADDDDDGLPIHGERGRGGLCGASLAGFKETSIRLDVTV